METAKLFMNGQSQAVRLPKEFRFSGDKVGIKKIGDIVLLFSGQDAWESFLKTPPVTDDFSETVIKARQDSYPEISRIAL